MSSFNKTDLARAVAPQLGMSIPDATAAIERIFAQISAAANTGHKVSIPGFGKFEVKERAARMGRNPATGQPIQIPASKSIGFKASKAA